MRQGGPGPSACSAADGTELSRSGQIVGVTDRPRLWPCDDRDPRVDRYARAAVERAGEALRESADLATSVIVYQIESTAFDLVRGGGTLAEDAERVLREPALRSN